jgi:hypothetical protein
MCVGCGRFVCVRVNPRIICVRVRVCVLRTLTGVTAFAVLDYAIENWEWDISTQPLPPARQIVGVHRPVNAVELNYRFVN